MESFKTPPTVPPTSPIPLKNKKLSNPEDILTLAAVEASDECRERDAVVEVVDIPSVTVLMLMVVGGGSFSDSKVASKPLTG